MDAKEIYYMRANALDKALEHYRIRPLDAPATTAEVCTAAEAFYNFLRSADKDATPDVELERIQGKV